jgi:hypothetical protein
LCTHSTGYRSTSCTSNDARCPTNDATYTSADGARRSACDPTISTVPVDTNYQFFKAQFARFCHLQKTRQQI